MNSQQQQQVIDKLEALIRETQATIDRVEVHGLDKTMPDDYEKLLDILDSAIKQQREHTWTMLQEKVPEG
ncbi:hypothetical protein HW452_14255 [Halomonas aquamarina]|uniref:Uncharacterized protein n=1 Tax=Vreelandella aquamarina TaxID=77097 RepID=A0ACC5VWV4_9GAMM|nr:hypothetical protein [Halomonas aquamarina]MBZ5488686.1 hypothetical protein [Halomonas aquamarina]